MKILITGGAGFIGSAIVKRLQQADNELFVLDNLSFGHRKFVDIPDTHFFKTDIRDAAEVADVMEQIRPDVVLHLAAIHFIPYCNQHPFEASDINIRGTINVVNAVKAVGTVKTFLFSSTAAVYPISDVATDENHAVLPLDIYGLSKLSGEEVCRRFHLETGIDTIVCRFFNAFGPNETNPHLIPEIEKQLREGKRKIALGNLSPKRDFIHTHDMANAIFALLQKSGIGYETFNLGRGIEYSVVEIVETFEKILGEKVEIEVDPTRTRKVERMHLLADVRKLKAFTGWEPQWSIEQGVKDLIDNWS